MLDIFIEAEAAVPDRHVARIGPVGDVDVVIGQQHAHRVAQQRREMAAERCHQQHLGLDGCTFLDEAQQRAERRGQHLLLVHGNDLVADFRFGNAEGGGGGD